MAVDLAKAMADARAAAKAASRWAYFNNYANGPKTISVRAPDASMLRYTGMHSWDYAKIAGCTTKVALAHLRKLVAAGLIVERKGWSGVRDFTLVETEAVALGEEIIVELIAEGLQFDDEWRAARQAEAAR